MMRNYQHTNWIWLGLLVASIFIGIAPFVAAAYLFVTLSSSKKPKTSTRTKTTTATTYNADGSYTVYKTEDTNVAPSAGQIAFRIVGGLIAGATLAFGLLIVGVILLFTLAPSVACGGSSKCM